MPRTRLRNGRYLRKGQGGIGGITSRDVTGPGHEPNFYVQGGTGGEGGLLGVASADASMQMYMSAMTLESGGAGPHFNLNMGIDRAAAEYWYTEIVHKWDNLHKFATGVEHYALDDENYFESPIHTDDGAGNLTYSYTRVISVQNGRQIFHPNPGGHPWTYAASTEFLGKDAAAPVVRVTGEAGQTADALEFYQGTTKKSGVNKGGTFVSDTGAAGIVMKDTQATPHYWRVSVSNVGALVITDLGTTRPTT
jgi:hypothetical protein